MTRLFGQGDKKGGGFAAPFFIPVREATLSLLSRRRRRSNLIFIAVSVYQGEGMDFRI